VTQVTNEPNIISLFAHFINKPSRHEPPELHLHGQYNGGVSDRITDPTGDFPKRVGMSGRRRLAVRTALRRRRDREGRRRAIVRWVLFMLEACEELAVRVWGAVKSPGSLRESGNN
jgi:hypothetical protein